MAAQSAMRKGRSECPNNYGTACGVGYLIFWQFYPAWKSPVGGCRESCWKHKRRAGFGLCRHDLRRWLGPAFVNSLPPNTTLMRTTVQFAFVCSGFHLPLIMVVYWVPHVPHTRSGGLYVRGHFIIPHHTRELAGCW